MKVQKHTTLDPELFMIYERLTTDSPIISEVTSRINKPGMKILDVGGASGIILNAIINKSRYKIDATILDMFKVYKQQLVNKQIRYIVGSILNNKLKAKSYDFVILRDVLHHLIAGGISEIQKHQEKAIKEMVRLTKKGGYIIFEEEINNSKLSSRIQYFLSSIANKIHFGSLSFWIGKVIVSFMSKKEIENVLKKQTGGIRVVKRRFIKCNFPFLWRSIFLMNKFQRAFYIIQKIS